MNELQKVLEALDPEEALAALAAAVKGLLSGLDDAARLHFLLDLLGERQGDKVSSMVHL
jgi:hypothetical protein